MAEFLIYNKDHWVTKLTSAEIQSYRKKYKHWDEKFLGHYVRDDVVECRPDGFWTGPNARGFNKDAFRVISVPGLSVQDAEEKCVKTKFKKSRYKILDGAGEKLTVVNNISDLTINDKGA